MCCGIPDLGYAYTVVNVPYGAMNAAITTDPTERAQLSTYRGIGSMIANIVVFDYFTRYYVTIRITI